jgi:Mn-dependent DtxR family transcriptional regulator
MAKRSKRDGTKDLAEELDVFDTMLSSLVEILEEKGILTYDQWENRIKQKSERAKGLSSFRDMQFKDNR